MLTTNRLEQIESYGLKTLDEDELVALLEKSAAGGKRANDDQDASKAQATIAKRRKK